MVIIKAAVKKTPVATTTKGAGRGSAKGSGGLSDGIKKKIGWLNNSGEVLMQAPIQFNEVVGPFSTIGDKAAHALLDELAEKSFTIRDPTKWLVSAASKNGGGSGGSWSKGSSKGGFGGLGGGMNASVLMSLVGMLGGGKGGGKVADKRGVSPAVRQKIGQLNNAEPKVLSQPLSFADVSGPLSECGEKAALELLGELESKAAEVKNPTSWLAGAAYRAKKKDDGLVKKTIGQMNNGDEVQLQMPIQFNEVYQPLMALGEEKAMELLNELKEKCTEVKNPTSWLKAAALRKI